jgi:hypothetical protein
VVFFLVWEKGGRGHKERKFFLWEEVGRRGEGLKSPSRALERVESGKKEGRGRLKWKNIKIWRRYLKLKIKNFEI